MHYFKLPSIIFLLAILTPSLAFPAPSTFLTIFSAPVELESTSEAPKSAAEPAALAPPAPGAAPPAEPQANGTAAGGACSPQVNALAQGIRQNIAVQNNELAAVTSLGAMLAENPIDQTVFAAGQSSLLGFVKQGIAIRENNQKIAPAGNAALPGLAMVAMAQMTELNLTMGIGMMVNAASAGGIDSMVASLNKTVVELKGDFAGGITQNMKNLAAATGNCTATTGTGTAPKSSPSAKPVGMAERRKARRGTGMVVGGGAENFNALTGAPKERK